MTLHFEEIQFLPSKKLKAFTDHTLIVGKSGSGKSNTAEFIITQKVSTQKVIDFVDRGRFESFLYSLPETNPKLVAKMSELSEGYLKPRSYSNQIILFAGARLKYYNTLPANIEVMSLDVEQLTLSDLLYLLGTTESAKALLGSIYYTHGELTLFELMKHLEQSKEGEHAQSRWAILRNIKRWLQSGLFDDDFPKINLTEIMNDKERITSFSSILLENEDEEGLAYGLLLKQMLEIKRRKLVKTKQCLYVREISTFMGQYATPHMQFARKGILSILREGRDLGTTLYADTQRAGDLRPTFRRQFGKIIQLKSDYADARMLLEIGSVPMAVLAKIPKLNCGEGLIITGWQYYYPCFFPPAGHLHKKPHFNVLNILSKHYGTKSYSSYNTRIRNNSPQENKILPMPEIETGIDNLLHG